LLKQNLNPTGSAERLPVDPVDESNVAGYADKIKKLCLACRVKTKKVAVSLPVSSVFHAIVTLPVVKKEEETRSMIRSEVKKFIPWSLEEMALDYQFLEKPTKEATTQKILVNAVPNKMISFYTKVFLRTGLKLEALEPESSALARSLIGRDQSVNMIVDIGAERTNFFIIENSVPIIHQSIDYGGHKIDSILKNNFGVQEDELVEQFKKDLFYNLNRQGQTLPESLESQANMFKPVIEPILKEIEVNLEIYLRQAGNAQKKPQKVILTGGTGFLPFLKEAIADKFKVKCYVGDPWARIIFQQSLKPVLHEIGPQMSVAIGLALRNMV